MRILALPGSLRAASINRQLLHAAAITLPTDADLEIFDGVGQLPLYDEDLDTEPAPNKVAALRATIERADAVLIATPEYNSSLPGPLKNALDWASRPRPSSLLGKPVAVVGASPSRFGAVWAQAEVRKVVAAIGAEVIDRELAVAEAHSAFDDQGRLTDADLQGRLAALAADLVSLATARARAGTAA